jgi:hypothetical protein
MDQIEHSPPLSPSELPTFLQEWEPMERPEDVALQVSLLTMELATVRQALKATQADMALVLDRIGL